ncbi:MAG: hypothetical protein U0793_33440 [Gemmataceae bacterium]
MTTETPSNLSGWAHRKLVLMPPANPDHVRRAFVERLVRADFAPQPDHQAAWLLLRDTTLPAGSFLLEEALVDAELGLRREIDDFAREFFSLVPAKRRARLDFFRSCCAEQPALLTRVNSLASGINIRLDSFRGDDTVAELAGRIAELFVLPPAERAARRRELLYAPPPGFAAAAQRVEARQPELAGLEPLLIAGLQPAAGRAGHVGRLTPGAKQPLRFVSVPPGSAARAAPQPASRPSGNGPAWGGGSVMVLLLIGAILRGLAGSGSNREQQRPRFDPAPVFPAPVWRPGEDPWKERRLEFKLPAKEGRPGELPRKEPVFDFKPPAKEIGRGEAFRRLLDKAPPREGPAPRDGPPGKPGK